MSGTGKVIYNPTQEKQVYSKMIRIFRIDEKKILLKARPNERFSIVFPMIPWTHVGGGFGSLGIIESPEMLIGRRINLFAKSLEEAEDLVEFLVDTGISAAIVSKVHGVSTDRRYFSVFDDISIAAFNRISVYLGDKEGVRNFLDLMKALSEREGYRMVYRLSAGQPDTLILK